MGSLHSRHRLARCSKPIGPLIGRTGIVQVIVAQARPCDQRRRREPPPGARGINPHRARSRIVPTVRFGGAEHHFPTIEMETHMEKFLLAILLIMGVAGCAPLTAQQKEAIDYQNHRPWSGG